MLRARDKRQLFVACDGRATSKKNAWFVCYSSSVSQRISLCPALMPSTLLQVVNFDRRGWRKTMEDEDEYWNLYWASKGTHLASSMMRLGQPNSCVFYQYYTHLQVCKARYPSTGSCIEELRHSVCVTMYRRTETKCVRDLCATD